MRLIAETTLSDCGRLIEPGEPFEIADAAGAVLLREGSAVTGEPELSPAEREAAAIVKRNAVDAIDAIEQVTDLDVLRAVGEAEDAGKQRSTVLAAVAARGQALTTI